MPFFVTAVAQKLLNIIGQIFLSTFWAMGADAYPNLDLIGGPRLPKIMQIISPVFYYRQHMGF